MPTGYDIFMENSLRCFGEREAYASLSLLQNREKTSLGTCFLRDDVIY